MAPQVCRVTGAKTEMGRVHEWEIEAGVISQRSRWSQPTRSLCVPVSPFLSFVPWQHMCRAELCFIKKSFLARLLIGYQSHRWATCISTEETGWVPLQLPPPTPFHCWSLVPLAGTCSEWLAPLSLGSLGILNASSAWHQYSLPLPSPLYCHRPVVLMLPITLP